MPFNDPIPPGPDDPERPRRDNGGLATLVQAEKMMQISILLPSAAFIGWLFGAWLDKKFHTSWIGIAGIVLGGISGLVYVIQLVIAEGNKKTGKGSGGL